MGLNLKKIGDNILDVGSKVYDQVNVFDNNRTFKQREATDNKSNFQQAGQVAGQTVRNTFPASAKLVNTVKAGAGGAYGLAQIGATSVLGSDQEYRNKVNNVLSTLNRDLNSNSGLLGKGTLFKNAQEAKDISGLDLAKKTIGSGAEIYLEGKTLKTGGLNAKNFAATASNQGKKVAFKQAVKPVLTNSALNTAQGGVSAYNQGASGKDIIKAAALGGTIGTAADLLLGGAGYGLTKGGKKIATDGAANIKPVYASTGEPAIVPRNKAATDKLITQGLPTTAPKEPARLLTAGAPVSTTVKGDGFTMTPKPNKVTIESGKQIAQIDKQLEQVRQGKSVKSPDEVRAIVQQRAALVDSIDNPLPKVGLKSVSQVASNTDTVKTQAQINRIDAKAYQAGRPLTKAEQIKTSLLMEKLHGTPEAPKLDVAQSIVADLAPASPYSGVPKSPNAFSRAWQTVNGVISEHGIAGKETARRIAEARNQSEVGQEAFIEMIPTASRLSKQDFETFVQSLEHLSRGEPVQLAPHIQQAVAEWNVAIPTIRDRAIDAGLEVGDLGPNYFPRQYKDLFNSDNKMSQMAADMVKNGNAKDLGDAVAKLQFMKNEYQRPFGNLEQTRNANLPNYEMTHEALTNYISRSYDRITKAEQLGPKNEILSQLQGRMIQDGYNAAPGSTVDKYIKTALGDVDRNTVGHKVSGKIRSFNALRSLSAAGISNATQLVNTATVGGVIRTGKAVVKMAVSPQARADAVQAGVLLDHSIANIASQGLGVSGTITRNIASPLFRQVEKFNRQATAIVGKDYGNSLAKKASQGNTRALETLQTKFGVKGEIGETLTRSQEIQVARKMVEIAQFKVDPMDLPGWVDSPMGKLVAQFRTFGYKQSDFMYNQVLREAMKGNVLPLTRFVALAVPAGTASLAAKGFIKGTDYTEDGESNASKVSKALSAVGGFGLPGSEAQNIYKSSQYGNTPGAIVSTVGGPTAGFLAETGDNIRTGQKSGDWSKIKKQAVRSIPAVGPSISNRAFPKKEQPKAVTAENKAKATVAELALQDKKEMDALKTSSGGGYSLQQLTSGKYAAQIGNEVKTFDNLKKARQAIAMDSFEKSDEKSKVIGDRHYFINENGEAKSEYKFKYEFDKTDAKNKLGMDIAQDAEDYGAWNTLAIGQLASLEKLRDNFNKEGQEDEVDKTQLKIENLKQSMRKYAGYGGAFTKGSGKNSGSSGNTGSIYKYAVSSNAGGSIARPKVSVKQTPAIQSKVVQSAAPKVSLKKSRV